MRRAYELSTGPVDPQPSVTVDTPLLTAQGQEGADKKPGQGTSKRDLIKFFLSLLGSKSPRRARLC